MALKIGSQPVSCDGKDSLQAVVNGLAKIANRPIDLNSLKVRIRRTGGEVIELSEGDSLELSASVAAPKSATKKDKSAAPKANPAKQATPAS